MIRYNRIKDGIMKEIILCKYGEIILKGANRPEFEGALTRELKRRLAPFGHFKIRRAESTIYITPEEDACDLDGAYETARLVFGFVGVTRAAECEKSMDSILETARAYLPPLMASAKTFRVDAKRSDKLFPKTSPEIAAEVGGAILSAAPRLRVDLHHPDAMIRVEIRDRAAYVHAGQEKGAGGLPRGTSGRGLLLLSGGIDSPVAGYMMAKRGVAIEALHFESFPYTSERAREKVFTLAAKLCRYCSRIHIHVISLTKIQEELRRVCDEEFFTLMLRRFMMKLAERCAAEYGCRALITGESLGQVASQTMDALAVTNAATSLPVLRPLIGMDKEEIVEISRRIGTFDTSILPYEDCCTVFTPRHPKTNPTENEIAAQASKIDFDALLDEAYATLYTETRRVEGYDS